MVVHYLPENATCTIVYDEPLFAYVSYLYQLVQIYQYIYTMKLFTLLSLSTVLLI